MAINEEVDIIMQILETELTFGEMTLSAMDLQYQGFSPALLMASMWASAKSKGIDQDTHLRNVRTMAATGLMRGSNLKSIEGKSTPALISALKKWKNTYGLTGGKPSSPKTVTLVRVSACLAKSLSLAMAKSTIEFSGAISANSVCTGFPAGMALANFGSLIPRPESGLDAEIVTKIFKAFLYHQYRFDQVINSNKEGYLVSLAKIKQYANIQLQSQLYNNDIRITHCVQIGVLSKHSGTYTIANEASGGIELAARLWESLNE